MKSEVFNIDYMKKLSELKKEQTELLGTDREEKKPRELTTIKKRLQFLKTCIAYLESQPSEEFVKSEVKRIEKRLKLIADAYRSWIGESSYDNESKKLAAYNKEYGVQKMKLQTKTLKFLLQ